MQDAAVRTRDRHHRFRWLAVVVAVASSAACGLDQAQLYRAAAPQVTAEVGQLRVLSHDDDPATEDWIDVVTPDPAVFDEGDAFREADSRTAAEDQPAEVRRLFTGVAAGRTLLVRLDRSGDDVIVWDLVVGDPDQPFSDGTQVAVPGRPTDVAVGDHVVVVRPGADGPADPVPDGGAEPVVELVGRHTPDDGADLFVDVFVARSVGEVDVTYDDEVFPVDVG